MIDVDKLIDDEIDVCNVTLDSGEGIIYDVNVWLNRYRKSLEDYNRSKNTIMLYNLTLEALHLFIKQYYHSLEGISSIINVVNPFLVWMEQYSVNKKYGSQKERLTLLKDFIERYENLSVENYFDCVADYFRDMNDDIVDTADFVIKDFYNYYRSIGGEVNQAKLKGYLDSRPRVSMATMNQRRIALIAFLNFIDKSMNVGHFSKDIWKIKTYKVPEKVNDVITGLTDDEDAKLLAYLNINPADAVSSLARVQPSSLYCEWRNRAMLILMRKAGLRSVEALRLKFSDITVNKSGLSFVLKVLGKGNKERRVPINKNLFAPYLEFLQNNKMGVYLSSTSSGAPMPRANLHIAIRDMYTAAGINRSGLHLLRHDFGSRFAAKNGNMKILQDILGHKAGKTTMIYSHVSDDVMANAVNQMDEAV